MTANESKHLVGNLAPARLYDDEIDLSELFNKVWRRKYWVVGASILSLLIAVLYLLATKPVYELKAQFRPANPDQFIELNQSGLIEIDPSQAFDKYRKNLASWALRRDLFSQSQMASNFIGGETSLSNDQLFDSFNEDIVIDVPVEKKNQVIISDSNTLIFRHFNPEFGADTVNQLIDLANKRTILELSEEYQRRKSERLGYLDRTIQNKLSLAGERRKLKITRLEEQSKLETLNLEDRLSAAKEIAKARRMEQIENIREAISIAEALNIVSPTTPSRLTEKKIEPAQTAINAEVGNREEPLYFRGTKLLNAELKALLSRNSDDFSDPRIRELESELKILQNNREVELLSARKSDLAFIDEQIAPLRDEIETLKSQKVSFETMSMIRVDHNATIPEKPIKPRKMLIISASIVLGCMMGFFIALVVPSREQGPQA